VSDGDTFVVLDSFPLPVQGTETRVNAGNEGNEFAVMYQEGSKAVRSVPRRRLCV
jgi:COP9 signalosome complex subunit 5